MLFKILSSYAVRKLVNPGFKKVTKVDSGNICIILSRHMGLGDFVMHNFIVQQLQIHGYFVTYGLSSSFFKRYKFFLENNSLTNKYLVLPKSKWKYIQFIYRIRKERIKAVISDDYPLISSIFFYLAGVPMIIGPSNGKILPFYTKENKMERSIEILQNRKIHYTDFVYSLLDLLGNNSRYKIEHAVIPYFPFKRIEIKELQNQEIVSLSIHLGGDNRWNRKWPINKYIEICQLFLTKYNGKIFLIGNKDEYLISEGVKDVLERTNNVKGKIINFCGVDLNTTATVISLSNIFIGNDSGPLHIANALNKRVIGIFGPSAIAVVNPTEYDKRNITVHLEMPCVPCLKLHCKLPENEKLSCLTNLPVEIVWKKLQNLL